MRNIFFTRLVLGVILVSVALSFYVSSVYSAAGINQTINFQGKLVDDEGLNVANGNYDVIFKLYDASSGGTELWTETWNSGTSQVNVQDGVFRVALGTHSSMASVNFNQDTIYLSVKVGADAEMTPRIRFTSVPYAFVAKTTVDDALDFAQFEDTLDLDASTSITADGAEYLSIVNTGTGYSLLVEDQLTDTTPFVIDAAGNVGIGTTVPGSTRLSVISSAAPSGDQVVISNSGYGTSWNGADGLQIDFSQGDDVEATDANAALRLNVISGSTDADTLYGLLISTLTAGASTETGLVIQSGWDYSATFAGSVGIGTTSPTGRLQVTGDEVRIGDAGTVNSATADGDLFVEDALEVDSLAGTGTRAVYSDANGLLTNTAPTSGAIGYWQRNGTTLAPATLTDYVGIGTTTADDELDVVGEIDTSTYYKLGNAKILDMENTSSLLVGTGAGASLGVGALENVLLGYQAGNALSSGDDNVMIGYRSGYLQTAASQNILIGDSAGYNINSGANIFIGSGSGYGGVANTSAANIGLGINTLNSVTDSTYNIAIGDNAGVSVTTGDRNLLLGVSSNVTSGSVSYSIAMGYGAEVSANYQLVVGSGYSDGQITDAYFGSGVTDSTPYDITFNATGGSGTDIAGANFILAGGKGTGAGDGGDLIFKTADTLTTGSTLQSLTEKMRITDEGNVGIGTTDPDDKLDVVGVIDTDSYYQISNLTVFDLANTETLLIGKNAGSAIGVGADYNLFIGTDVGKDTTGDSNTAIGYRSMYVNTSGYNNVATGMYTLNANLTGWSNNAFGMYSLWKNTDGYLNSAFGHGSLGENTTGNDNAAFGRNAGYNSQTGNYNVFLGPRAGIGTTLYTGSDNNVMIGYEAGASVGNNQDGNVFLGYQAGYSESGSNKLYIENSNSVTPLIWGDFSTDVLGVNGSVGIGLTNPTGRLQVTGDEVRIGSAGTVNSATADGDLFVEDALEVDSLAGTGTRAVYSDANGLLTNTAPTSGTIGYWSRTGTTLSPTTANDIVSVANTTTTGADLSITNTGVYTGTGIFNLTANSATTGTLANISGTALTSGNGLLIQGPTSGSTLTGNLLQINTASTGAAANGFVRFNFSAAHTGNGVQIDDATATGTALALNTNSLTTGDALNITSTSTTLTTGSLADLYWNPSGSTEIYSTGDVFKINIGQYANPSNIFAIYDNGTELFSIDQAKITSALPHEFTAAGDVSMSYDLIMTNTTASYIKFEGPGYVQTSHPSGNYDLTLSAANAGSVVIADNLLPGADDTYDLGSTSLRWKDLYVGGETIHIGSTTTDEATISYTSGDILAFGTDSTTNGDISFFTDDLYLEKTGGYVGVGTTTPGAAVDIWGTDATRLRLYAATGATPQLWFRDNVAGNDSLISQLSSGSLSFSTESATSALVITTGGNVGIGTTSPTARLSVSKAVASGVNTLLQLNDTGTISDTSSTIDWRNSEYSWDQGRIAVVRSGSSSDFHMAFSTAVTGGLFERMRILANGNVGIGITNPGHRLDVSGGAYASDYLSVGTNPAQGGYLRIPNGQYINARNFANTADINMIRVNTSNNVQLGTPLDMGNQAITGVYSIEQYTSSNWSLTSGGNLNLAGTFSMDSTNIFNTGGRFVIHDTRAVADIPTDFNQEMELDFKSRATIGAPGSTGTYGGLLTIAPWTDDSGDAHHQLFLHEDGISYRQGQPNSASWGTWYGGVFSGNVGIGTTAPATDLNILDDSGAYVRLSSSASTAYEDMGGYEWYQTTGTAAVISRIWTERGGGDYDQGRIRFATNNGTTLTDRMMIAENGTVGIGTTTIGSTLQVNGSTALGYSASTVGPTSGLAVSGNVGIGTTTVGSKLQVNGNAAIGYSASTAGPSSGLAVSGSVGIGTTAAGQELDVNGQIQFNLDGTSGDNQIGVCKSTADSAGVQSNTEFRDCSSTAGDIAESYRSQPDLRPGDVVALKTIDGIPTLVKAETQNLAELFGVVSTFPVGQFGAPLDHDSYTEDELPTAVGLTGKVPVVVGLEGGIIKTGDPLTISSIPGIAKKSTGPGKIIGYAVEPYDGTVRVSHESRKQENNRNGAITKFNLDPVDPQAPYGKILVMASLGYHDIIPGLALVGDVSVQKTSSGYRTYSSSLDAVLEHLVAGAKGIFGISEMGFAKIDSAEIESATISNLNVTNFSIGSNTINSEFISKMSGIDTMLDYSPTSGISFLAPVTTTELVAGKITTSQLEVQGITFAQKVDVQTVETQLSSIDARVDGLEARMDGVEYEISQLKDQVASMSAQLDGINSQFASWQETVGTGSAVLGASGSATLADNIATLSGLMIDGKTTTFDLDVLGNINAGLLEIGGTSGTEINSLGTVVSIQALAQGGIEFVGGKVTIDTDGNMKTMAAISADTTEAREIVARKTGETAPTVGEGTILAGQTQVVITNTNVASNSKIFVTATTSTGGQPLIVKTKTNGSFTVAIDTIHGTNIKFDYWILGVK